MFWMVALILKIIFKNKKYYFNIFQHKKYFKNNYNYIFKHAFNMLENS